MIKIYLKQITEELITVRAVVVAEKILEIGQGNMSGQGLQEDHLKEIIDLDLRLEQDHLQEEEDRGQKIGAIEESHSDQERLEKVTGDILRDDLMMIIENAVKIIRDQKIDIKAIITLLKTILIKILDNLLN